MPVPPAVAWRHGRQPLETAAQHLFAAKAAPCGNDLQGLAGLGEQSSRGFDLQAFPRTGRCQAHVCDVSPAKGTLAHVTIDSVLDFQRLSSPNLATVSATC